MEALKKKKSYTCYRDIDNNLHKPILKLGNFVFSKCADLHKMEAVHLGIAQHNYPIYIFLNT